MWAEGNTYPLLVQTGPTTVEIIMEASRKARNGWAMLAYIFNCSILGSETRRHPETESKHAALQGLEIHTWHSSG